MQQSVDHSFDGATLAILFEGRVAVTSHAPAADGSTWSLPSANRMGDESPAQCALRIMKALTDLDLPLRRLNWPVTDGTEDAPSKHWFFSTSLTPAEWSVVGAKRPALATRGTGAIP